MTNNEIEREANEYSKGVAPLDDDFDEFGIAQAFEEGARWRMNSVWHKPDDCKPMIGYPAIIQFYGEFHLGWFVETLYYDEVCIRFKRDGTYFNLESIKQFAYLKDIVPGYELEE